MGDELPEEFENLLGTLRRIAKHFDLTLLQETVDQALRITPADSQQSEEELNHAMNGWGLVK